MIFFSMLLVYTRARLPSHYTGEVMNWPILQCSATAVERGCTLAACRSEEHTSELQSHSDLVCRLLLEKKKTTSYSTCASRCEAAVSCSHRSHVVCRAPLLSSIRPHRSVSRRRPARHSPDLRATSHVT